MTRWRRSHGVVAIEPIQVILVLSGIMVGSRRAPELRARSRARALSGGVGSLLCPLLLLGLLALLALLALICLEVLWAWRLSRFRVPVRYRCAEMAWALIRARASSPGIRTTDTLWLLCLSRSGSRLSGSCRRLWYFLGRIPRLPDMTCRPRSGTWLKVRRPLRPTCCSLWFWCRWRWSFGSVLCSQRHSTGRSLLRARGLLSWLLLLYSGNPTAACTCCVGWRASGWTAMASYHRISIGRSTKSCGCFVSDPLVWIGG
jgi:hypothetical protein